AQVLVAVAEVQVLVAGQRAGQQVRLAQDLEAVADAEHGQPVAGRLDDRVHDRGEPRDRAAAQVVAVGEAAGQDHRVDPVQVDVLVGALDVQREVFDHRVGQQLVGDLAGPLQIGDAGELDLDALADAYRRDVVDTEPGQRVRDRLTLRVEDLRFEHDVHHDAG